MINKKIAISMLSIVTALAMAGGATYAFFSDVATSSNNVFATGTLDLKLTDNNETALDSVTASFGSGTLVPGSCTGNQTLDLRNNGTVAANHAEVKVANVVSDTNNDANPDMDTFLTIDTLQYDSGNVISQITDLNSNGRIDLADWQAGAGLDNLALADLNTNHQLVLNVCLDNTAPNAIQADSVTSTFTVDLNQSATQ